MNIFNSITSPKVPQNTTLTENDVQLIKQAMEKGASQEEAFSLVSEFKYNQEQQQAKQAKLAKQNEGFLGGISGGIMNTIGGVVEETPRILGETAKFMSKAGQYNPLSLAGTAIRAGFSDKTYGQLREEQKGQAEKFSQAGEQGAEFIKKYGQYNPESKMAGVGRMGADVASLFIGPNKGKVVTEGASLLGKYGAKALNLAQEGAIMGGKYDIATKGEITPEGVGYGAAGNLAFGGLLGGGKMGYDYLTTKYPASITLGGLMSASRLGSVKDALIKDEGVAVPKDVGKWILDRVKPGNKQSIGTQLSEYGDVARKQLDDALSQIGTMSKSKSIDDGLKQLIDDSSNVRGLQGKIETYQKLLEKGEYTLSEKNFVKRELDDLYTLFKESGEATAGLKAKGLQNIRRDIRESIEKEAEKYGVDAKRLNNEISTAKGLSEGILKKDNVDAITQTLRTIGTVAPGGVIAGSISYKKGDDPMTVLGNFLFGAVANRALTSTYGRTLLAKGLNSLTPKEFNALDAYIKSGGKNMVHKKVVDELISQGRLLPKSTKITPAKPIVTPQTLERAIITESQKGLSSNVKRPKVTPQKTKRPKK